MANSTTTSTTTSTEAVDLARAALEERRAQLLSAIGEVPDAPDGAASSTLGETEHLANYQQRAIDGARTTMLAAELEDVTDALARLDAGTWGICDGCGNEIAAERLEVVPAARSCVRCG